VDELDRVDELDGAGTHEFVYHIRGEHFYLPWNGNSSTLTGSRTFLAYRVLPHLAPQCCVTIEITSLSREGLATFACAPLRSNVCIDQPSMRLLFDLFATLSFVVAQTALTPMPTLRRLPKRHTFGLKMLTPIGIALAMARKLTARWCYQCLRPCRSTTKVVLCWKSTSTRASMTSIPYMHTSEVSTEVRSTGRTQLPCSTTPSF
jgi:hypothetical protein